MRDGRRTKATAKARAAEVVEASKAKVRARLHQAQHGRRGRREGVNARAERRHCDGGERRKQNFLIPGASSKRPNEITRTATFARETRCGTRATAATCHRRIARRTTPVPTSTGSHCVAARGPALLCEGSRWRWRSPAGASRPRPPRSRVGWRRGPPPGRVVPFTPRSRALVILSGPRIGGDRRRRARTRAHLRGHALPPGPHLRQDEPAASAAQGRTPPRARSPRWTTVSGATPSARRSPPPTDSWAPPSRRASPSRAAPERTPSSTES